MASGGQAPGPRGALLLGSLRAFREDPVGLLVAAHRDHGDVVRLRLGPTVAHLLSHPRGIRHVLQTRHPIYTKNTPGVVRLRDFLGNGLLTSDGDFWRKQRRTAQPAFHRERIQAFASLMSTATGQMLDAWDRRLEAGSARIDIAEEMMALTLRIVAEALFGAEVGSTTHAVGEALEVVLQVTNARVKRVVGLPRFLPTPENRRFRRAVGVLDGVVEAMVGARRTAEARDDLLSMLVAARDPETGRGMDDRQLRDEILTVLLAGHETTANALTWSLYLLSRHPEEQVRLEEEVDRVLGGRAPTLDDLGSLTRASLVVQEAMRLYPPAWLFGRSPTEDDEVDGYRIEAGSLVFLSPYVTQRRPDLWPEPERFLPDRFAGASAASLDRFAYFPFGGGPRQCIGLAFANLEMQIVMARLAGRYRLRLAPDARVDIEPLVTLRPRHGMPMIASPR
jgi:cytochrome P450